MIIINVFPYEQNNFKPDMNFGPMIYDPVNFGQVTDRQTESDACEPIYVYRSIQKLLPHV